MEESRPRSRPGRVGGDAFEGGRRDGVPAVSGDGRELADEGESSGGLTDSQWGELRSEVILKAAAAALNPSNRSGKRGAPGAAAAAGASARYHYGRPESCCCACGVPKGGTSAVAVAAAEGGGGGANEADKTVERTESRLNAVVARLAERQQQELRGWLLGTLTAFLHVCFWCCCRRRRRLHRSNGRATTAPTAADGLASCELQRSDSRLRGAWAWLLKAITGKGEIERIVTAHPKLALRGKDRTQSPLAAPSPSSALRFALALTSSAALASTALPFALLCRFVPLRRSSAHFGSCRGGGGAGGAGAGGGGRGGRGGGGGGGRGRGGGRGGRAVIGIYELSLRLRGDIILVRVRTGRCEDVVHLNAALFQTLLFRPNV
eukprot:GHVU01224708.1.p1 GENE.GHVU01224708.1~~GHVU01224708.1.p1  ORF type:complete len:378 (+),score=57.18 GHVU01224708.1:475-1608(+)